MQTTLKKYSMLKALNIRTQKENQKLKFGHALLKLGMHERDSIIKQGAWGSYHATQNMNTHLVSDELAYFKKKACELELEVDRLNNMNRTFEKITEKKDTYGPTNYKQKKLDDESPENLLEAENLSIENREEYVDGLRSKTAQKKTKKMAAIEGLMKKDYAVKKSLFQWVEMCRGINHTGTDFIPSFMFLKWRILAKPRHQPVSKIHKDLDNQYINTRWAHQKSVLKAFSDNFAEIIDFQ